MEWFENKTTQLIALVSIVGTLAGFGYTGATYINRLENLEDKIIKVKVPAGTQPNTILQVKGQGMPVHKTIGIRGNFYVKIHVLIPQLSVADLKKIQDL